MLLMIVWHCTSILLSVVMVCNFVHCSHDAVLAVVSREW